MLKNNNKKVIARMARNSILGNRRKNAFIIAAVILSSFMVSAVLTLGASYYQASRLQNIRQYGAKHDAVLLGGVKEDQIQMCRENPEIEYVGLKADCGKVQSNGRDDTLHTELVWCNDVFWERQKKPALQYVTGSYPVMEDELMISEEALKECGEEGMGPGSSLELIYEDGMGIHRKVFTISGVFQDYHKEKEAYVSEGFFKKSGFSLSDIRSGSMYLEFRDWIWLRGQQGSFEEELHLGKQQSFFLTDGAGDQLQVLLGLAGIALITLCSAYLLIYNILFLSVTSRVRYYGLLQTVGMTERQIRALLYRRMSWLGGIGIAAGLLLGGSVSMIMLPEFLRGLGIKSEDVIEVSFRPWIYLLTAVLVGVTVYIGSRKPARIAGSVSPVEASRFAGGYGGKRHKRIRKGRPVLNIACRNLLREKKRTAVVVLSMGLSVSLFLCIVTLIQSQEARTLIPFYMDSDMVIENDTFTKINRIDYKQIFTPELVDSLEQVEGVSYVNVTYGADIIVPWEEGLPDVWMREFYATAMAVPYDQEDYRMNPEKYYSVMAGIGNEEFERMNAGLETPIDPQKFYNGEVCVIYRSMLGLSDESLSGQKIRFYPQKEGEGSMQEIEIAGVTDSMDIIRFSGYGPNIVVSSAYLEKIVAEPYRQRIAIHYKQRYDEKTEQQIKDIVQKDPCAVDSNIVSRVQIRENLRNTQGNVMIFGVGIAVLVGFIGLMNYINTVISNLQSRLVELSVLESIGMTGRQTRRMLLCEGLLYAGLTILFTITAGLGATYLVFQFMNNMHAPFTVPTAPSMVSLVLIIAVCTGIPTAAYQFLVKDTSVIDRIRES